MYTSISKPILGISTWAQATVTWSQASMSWIYDYTKIGKPGAILKMGYATGVLGPPTYSTTAIHTNWIKINKPTSSNWINIPKPT